MNKTSPPDGPSTLQRVGLLLRTKLGRATPWQVKPEGKTADYPLIRLNQLVAKAKQDDREAPYYLRGRGDEFNLLASRLMNAPNPIALVTGPPGTGKTSLLKAVSEYARLHGHIIVRLQADDLTNRATLAQKCRDAVMAREDAPGENIITASRAEQHQLQAETNALFVRLGEQIDAAVTQTEQRQSIGRVDLIKHLHAVCQYGGRTQRLLITCDKIQRLQEVIIQDSTIRTEVVHNLGILNDEVLKNAANLPITTIFAGLNPARDFIRNIISRPASASDLELTPVATQYCRDIIDDYLRIDPLTPELVAQLFSTEWRQHWASSCNGHVLFANHIGQLMQEAAIKKHDNPAQLPMPPEEHQQWLDSLDEQRDIKRTNYYDSRLPAAKEKIAHLVLQHLVVAHNTNTIPDKHGNLCRPPLTAHAVESLAERVCNTVETNPQSQQQHTAEEILLALQHRGIIRYMQYTDSFIRLRQTAGQRSIRCIFPIPSISEHVQNQIDKLPKDQREAIENTVRAHRERYPPTMETVWQWRQAAERVAIPRIPEPEEKGIVYEDYEDRTNELAPDPTMPPMYKGKKPSMNRNIPES